MPRFVATTSPELGPISDLIEDAWFTRDDLVRDINSKELVVLFKQEPRAWGERFELELLRRTWRYNEYRVALRPGILKIRHVESVDADESFGEMDMLEGLEYDESKREVMLVSFGLLRVRVAQLALQAEITPPAAVMSVVASGSGFGGLATRPIRTEHADGSAPNQNPSCLSRKAMGERVRLVVQLPDERTCGCA